MDCGIDTQYVIAIVVPGRANLTAPMRSSACAIAGWMRRRFGI